MVLGSVAVVAQAGAGGKRCLKRDFARSYALVLEAQPFRHYYGAGGAPEASWLDPTTAIGNDSKHMRLTPQAFVNSLSEERGSFQLQECVALIDYLDAVVHPFSLYAAIPAAVLDIALAMPAVQGRAAANGQVGDVYARAHLSRELVGILRRGDLPSADRHLSAKGAVLVNEKNALLKAHADAVVAAEDPCGTHAPTYEASNSGS